MKQIILGTAGHIDHGKTTLVKTITGIDTDRLKEEKNRGITIELGFAYLDLPNGQRIGIIDVPGHEKFIKKMVSGAIGVDLIALVIAADEGIKPQTCEHLEICKLLGISQGIVIISKIDIVSKEWLNLINIDIREYIKDSFLADAPIIPISAITKQGIPELLFMINKLTLNLDKRLNYGPWRLPIDRVFTIKGFGTIVTGTGIGSSIKIGQEVTIYPEKITAKIRGLQVYNNEVQQAHGGERIAINLQGIEKSLIKRGDIVATLRSLQPSLLIDVKLIALNNIIRPLKHRSPIRLLIGSKEIMGYIILLDRNELKAGESTYCQIKLDHNIAVVAGDRYILRSYSPITTIAGGIVLHPHPKRHKRWYQEIINDLHALDIESATEQIIIHAKLAGINGITNNELMRLIALPKKDIYQLISSMLTKQKIICFDKENSTIISVNMINYLLEEAQKILSSFHVKFPLKFGMNLEEFRQRLLVTVINSKLYNYLLHKLIKEEKIITEKGIIRLITHQIRLKKEDQILRKHIEQIYLESNFTPPWYKEFIEKEPNKNQANKLLNVLISEGVLIKIKDGLYYHHNSLEALKSKLIIFFSKNFYISIPQFKELTGLSRKYLISLLEYFDAIQLTIRIGDKRMLRKK